MRRVAVIGGSYGGYMSLACMEHYHDRLRCGIDVVGSPTSFHSEEYAGLCRDLRRVIGTNATLPCTNSGKNLPHHQRQTNPKTPLRRPG